MRTMEKLKDHETHRLLFGSLKRYAQKRPLKNDQIKEMMGDYLQKKHKLNTYSIIPLKKD